MQALAKVLLGIAIVVLAIGVIALVRGRIDMLRIPNRRAAGFVTGGAVVAIIVAAGIGGATAPHKNDSPAATPATSARTAPIATSSSVIVATSTSPATATPTVAATTTTTTAQAALPATSAEKILDPVCGPGQAPNDAQPSFYAEQYNASIAKPVNDDLAKYNAAVRSGDAEQISYAAGSLYSVVASNELLFKTGRFYGCYSVEALNGLIEASESYSAVLDQMSVAEGSALTGLEQEAKREQPIYIDSLNAYADQFGGNHARG